MDILFSLFKNLADPDWIMSHGGLLFVLLILFIETGLFFGFFLPGDPLLFISGMIISSAGDAQYPFNEEYLNLFFWMTLFSISTILGNFFGYWFGNKFQHLIHREKDGFFIKKRYIQAAHEFYEKKGGFAIGIARFLPIVRTFAPIIAGAVQMEVKKFSFYNIIGAIVWVGSITSVGFTLGSNEWVKHNLEYVMIGIILVVTAPVVFKFIIKKK